MSLRASTACPVICSGDMYCGVPTIIPAIVMARRFVAVGDAEIEQAERAGVLGDEQVGRLDVAMDDAAGVRVGQAGAQLGQPVDLAGQGHLLAAADHLRHRPAGDELHRQVRVALVLADRVDADDVGVMDLGGEPCLAQEAPAGLVVGHLQDLDGDRPVEHRVETEVHDSHAAVSEAVPDFIRADMCGKLFHVCATAVL